MHGRPFGALPFRHLSPTSMRKGRTFGPHTPDLHDCRVSWTETVRWNLTCSAPHHRPGECIRTADRDTTLSASGHREALQEGRWPVQGSPCYCDHLTRQCSLFTRAVRAVVQVSVPALLKDQLTGPHSSRDRLMRRSGLPSCSELPLVCNRCISSRRAYRACARTVYSIPGSVAKTDSSYHTPSGLT
jgi:hypothetical protein